MNKLKMQTPDLTNENISKIAELFPNVITEKEGKDGKIVKAIDFDLLKQLLSKELIDDENERYRLDWPGKKASLLKANTPIVKTLRPDRDSSVNFDTTENVYIEGDNFEVLKILQESYLNKIKMIYIDPPYNTGKDFVYRDNRTVSKEDYEEEIGLEDEEGGKLFRNTDTNGRFHSDWLSMMYERLVVARDLLSDNGVIFISIGEDEFHNLRKLCDEIFGEDSFINKIVWKKNSSGKTVTEKYPENIDYLLMYGKTKKYILQNIYKPLSESTVKTYSKDDNDGRGKYCTVSFQKTGSPGPQTTYDYIDNNGKLWKCPIKGWRMTKEKIKNLENNGRVYFDGDTLREKCYWNERENEGQIADTLWDDIAENNVGTAEVDKLLGKGIFTNPKPTELIQRCINTVVEKQDLILDFFSGSASTAHAVMQLNAEDGGNRKFIMVQIPEETAEDSEAFKAGYKTISQIGMERIRRAGKKIVVENSEKLKDREKQLDIGFRVYKTDSTNMKDVYYHPTELKQENLFSLVSNIKDDRTPEDLLTQVILDLGLTLDLPVETKKIKENTVYFVAGNSLVACFDDNIDFSIVDEIAKEQPLKVVFKDASFKEEQDRTNVDTRFKRLSPETIITVL